MYLSLTVAAFLAVRFDPLMTSMRVKRHQEVSRDTPDAAGTLPPGACEALVEWPAPTRLECRIVDQAYNSNSWQLDI